MVLFWPYSGQYDFLCSKRKSFWNCKPHFFCQLWLPTTQHPTGNSSPLVQPDADRTIPHSKCPAQIRNEILVSPPRAFWGSKNIPAGITTRQQKRPCTPPEATGGELPHLSLERQPAQPARSTPAEHSAECDIWLQVYQWLKNWLLMAKAALLFQISLRYIKFDPQHKHFYFKI